MAVDYPCTIRRVEKVYKYNITLSSRNNCGGVIHYRAYVVPDITNEEIKEILTQYIDELRWIYYLAKFTRRVLIDVLGFDTESADRIIELNVK